jgi:hypothetical protein
MGNVLVLKSEVKNMAMGQPPQQPTRSCVKCGRAIAWDVNVCPYCGHDFRPQMTGQQPMYGQPAYGQPAYGQPMYGQPPHEAVSGGLKILLYLLSFIIPIAGFIIGAIYYTKPETKEVGMMCIILGVISIILTVVCYFVVFAWIWGSSWYYWY